jgi:hypothetical protein
MAKLNSFIDARARESGLMIYRPTVTGEPSVSGTPGERVFNVTSKVASESGDG